VIAPFEAFEALAARYGAAFACHAEAHAPHDLFAGDWRLLALECRERVDDLNGYDAALDFEPPRRIKRTPHHGTPTSTSTGTGQVGFPDSDPLKSIPAALYLPALTGTEVSSTGRCRCPMPDHLDENPSAKAYGVRWKCFSCNAGTTIIDLGAAIYGLETTGPDFLKLRCRIAAALLDGGVHV
jgi:hypothetical protein